MEVDQGLPKDSGRVEGPTPSGGAYAIAYWKDREGNPTTHADAVAGEFVEFDRDGRAIARTYADLRPPAPEAQG